MDESKICTPPKIREEAKNVEYDQLLPEKSKDYYIKVYSGFKDWCQLKEVSRVSENVLLVYFQEKALNRKASSLWATFSMLKQTLKLKENIDISKYYQVIAFLKRKNDSYIPKKAAVFEKEQITKFITESPDETFLSTKVVFVIGIAGACRTDELCNMKLTDVDVRDDIIIVNIPHTKTKSSRKFVIVEPLWINVVKKYLANRPSPDMEKLFIGFRSGKPTRQNMGHNTISQVSSKIAKYLKLSNASDYTGHTLRRTSATILADNGGDILSLKRHGGWKSSTVAEGYVEDSISTTSASSTSTNSAIFETIPSTSVSNTEVNIPVENFISNAGTSGINMTCHNCTKGFPSKI